MARIFNETFTSFTAAGFAATPAAGQLDSDIFVVTGLSDNVNPTFGFTGASGTDFGRGVISGDPTTAGVYAAPSSAPNGGALLYQPTAAEGDNDGAIVVRIQNTTGAPLTEAAVGFDWVYRNTGDRAGSLVFEYSTNGTSYTPVPAGAFTTPTTLTGQSFLYDSNAGLTLTGLNVADGGFLYLRFRHDISTGSGSRDEFGVDNLTVDTPDAPATPVVTIAASDATATEGSDPAIAFTLTRTGDVTDPLTVSYTVAPAASDGATPGADFTPGETTGTATFAAGSTTATVSFTATDDTAVEPTESFTVTLADGAAYDLGAQASASATIADNDAAPTPVVTIAATDGDASEGLAPQLVYTLTRTGDLAGELVVNYAVAPGSPFPIDPAADIVDAGAGVARFAAGAATATITLSAVDDAVGEVVERLLVNVVDGSAYDLGATSSAAGVIRDNDPAFRIRTSQVRELERDTGATPFTFGIDQSNTFNQPVTLSYDITGIGGPGQADADDFAGPLTGEITFEPGQSFGQLTILVSGDRTREADETFSVTLRDPSAGSVVVATASGVIRNDEGFAIAPTQASGNEGTGTPTPFNFVVTRPDALAPATVDYRVAFAGSDAEDFSGPTAGTLSFATGEVEKTLTILVNGDSATELDEGFRVELVNPTDEVLSLSGTRAAATILNDDGAVITIGDAALVEGGGTSDLVFTLSRRAIDLETPVTVDYTTVNGTALAGEDFVAASGTATFAPGELTTTIRVQVTDDIEIEPTESFEVRLSNPSSGAIFDAVGVGTITSDDATQEASGFRLIHEVQGTAFYSPLLANEGKSGFNQPSTGRVTVEGVIVAIDSFGGSGPTGFYLVEETSDWDDDFRTSEGIYVRTTALSGLTVGEVVRVEANIQESQDFTNLNRTTLVNPTIVSQSNTSELLPTLVLDGSGPGTRIPNTITSDDNPLFNDASDGPADAFDPENDALDFYETIEGMRVTMPDMVVGDGFVGGSNNDFVYFNAYSRVHADPDQINSRGGYTISGDPEFYPLDTDDAQDGVIRGGRHLHDGDLNPDTIELDFGNVGRGGADAFDELLTMGDRLGDVTGVLDFDFGAAKLYVTDAIAPPGAVAGDLYAGLRANPTRETTTLDGADTRSLRVATFNVENLSPVGTPFDDRSGLEITTEAKFDGIADDIAFRLQAPDIIILEEVLDNDGIDVGTTEADQTLQKLVDELNARTGKTYQWVDEAPEVNNTVGGAPNGNQRVAFLYDTARVQLGDLPADASLEERRQFTDRLGDGARTAGDRIAFDDSQLGGEINTSDWSGTRRSLLGEFTFNGNTVYALGHHWPSKGGSGRPLQLNQNIDAGEPRNADWQQRNNLAQDTWAMMNLISTSNINARVVSGGDYNEFWFYRPMEVVSGYVDANGAAREGGTRYTNLMVSELPAAERFSYDFDGRSQVLDSILSDQALAAVADYDVVHINTGYNDRSGAVNPATSDHDPSLARFDFRDFSETLFGGLGDDLIRGAGGDDSIAGGAGNDALAGDAGDDGLAGGEGNDTLDGGEGDDDLAGQAGDDVLAGGAGADVADGGAGADLLSGDAGADVLVGGEGGDQLYAGDDDDVAGGSLGEDLVEGGSGNDQLYGNEGNDLVVGGLGDDVLAGNDGIDQLYGAEGNDVLAGGADDDRLAGGAGEDEVYGEAGDDILGGAEGADILVGGSGADQLYGEDGDDILQGDGGSDLLLGGAGDDLFVFGPLDGGDRIVDFTPGGSEDRIVLKGVAGVASFDAVMALATERDGGTTLVFGESDFIFLDGVSKAALTADDFVFG